MSSFLDCEWQHRPDETTASLTNPISTTTTTSDGLLPSHVGSCSYCTTSDRNGEGDVSYAVVATATATAAATTIKSEQAMLLDDDDETADDDNQTAGSRYKNYDDDDFDFSDDEAIIARMKIATKKKPEGTKRKRHENNPGNNTDRSGNSNSNGNTNSKNKDDGSDNNVYSAKRIRAEVDVDILFPSSLPVMSYSHQAAPDVDVCNNEGDGGGDSIPVLRPRNAKITNSTSIIVSGDSIQSNVLDDNDETAYGITSERNGDSDLSYAVSRNDMSSSATATATAATTTAATTAATAATATTATTATAFQRGTKRKRRWEERLQELAEFKRKFLHTNVPQRYTENKQLGIWVMNQRIQYKLFKANNNKSFMTRERIQSLKELDFKWQLGKGGRRTRSNSSSLVESSLSKTEDGYESDNSELYVII